jgi:hypothetical protein
MALFTQNLENELLAHRAAARRALATGPPPTFSASARLRTELTQLRITAFEIRLPGKHRAESFTFPRVSGNSGAGPATSPPVCFPQVCLA